MKKFSLLYVDDEQSNLRIFKDTFRRKYNIFTSTSAKEGIEILKNNKIDLILSDQRMPEMSGVEFLKYSFENFPEPNRIMITGYSDFDAIENAINNAHIIQYIQKPWDENNLSSAIENALRLYELEKINKEQKAELKKQNEEFAALNEEYKTTNEKLIIAKRKAEESNLLKTEFINNMSHEIRTPLNGILGFSALLNEQNLTDEKRRYFINIIQNSGNQLLRIIDDILEISKLETKQVKKIEKEIYLNDLLLELFSIFDIKAKENNTTLYLKKGLSDKDSLIYIDDSKLIKILSNLLENALKFTNEGNIEFGYSIIKKNNKEFLEIYVKDTGIGIDIKNQKMIFERFSREAKEITTKIGGLGLGLSIAKENAELLGGDLSLISEKGKGSSFIVTIPYSKINIEHEQINSNKTFINEPNKKNNLKILIAEDEEINFLYLETIIGKLYPDTNIIHAKNGEEAIKSCIEIIDIDLVLIDLKMPKINGLEVTKQIRKFNPNLTLIAQTAYSTPEEKEEALLAGCNDFISKPISRETMKKILKKYTNVML